MEAIFEKAVARNNAAKKTSVPWQSDVPHPQAYYAYNSASKQWEEHHGQQRQRQSSQTSHRPGQAEGHQQEDASSPSSASLPRKITRIALYAWNIDFMLPHAEARMKLALQHLEDLVSAASSTPSTSPDSTNPGTIVFLQECTEPDLLTIAANPWGRENFILTDLDNSNWTSGYYGTTTLVDRRLLSAAGSDVEGGGDRGLASCFRVHYDKTRMERDVLFVDVDITRFLPSHSGPDDRNDSDEGEMDGRKGNRKVLRVGNTHLESMAFEPPYRPPQVEIAARFMKGEASPDPSDSETEIYAALLAGDFNAVQSFDLTLHSDNGLRDAYLDHGGKEDSDEGYTWGQQAATVLRERFGCSRMDKVYYCSTHSASGKGEGLRLVRFERFGAGVELENEKQRQEIVALGFDKPWITDHLGVLAEFDICG